MVSHMNLNKFQDEFLTWKVNFELSGNIKTSGYDSYWSNLCLKTLFLMALGKSWLIDWPLCWWWLIWPLQKDVKTLKNDWNPGKWVLIWEYSARAFQWIPRWQGLDGFQKSLHPCALDESSKSIGRVKLGCPVALCLLYFKWLSFLHLLNEYSSYFIRWIWVGDMVNIYF